MDQYFIDRTHKKLLELAAQNPKDKIEFAYFVDEKIDHKHDRTDDDATDLSHLIINNSTFSNIGFKKTKALQCDFSFCVFINCYFKWADFQQVKFQSCEFINCNFEYATFVGCDFQYAEFSGCYIPYTAIKSNLPHERENINRSLCRTLSIQCLQLGAVEDYKQFLFEERNAGEIHAIRKLFHSSTSYYKKYSLLDGLEGLLYYMRSKISKYLWGYGEKMGVLVRNIILVILAYAAVYFPSVSTIVENPVSGDRFLSAVYLSTCTFFSGNIDLQQLNSTLQMVILSEHVLGAILVGFFGAALFRQINRR